MMLSAASCVHHASVRAACLAARRCQAARRVLAARSLCSNDQDGSSRQHIMLQSEQHSFYWGQHTPAAGPSALSAAAASASTATAADTDQCQVLTGAEAGRLRMQIAEAPDTRTLLHLHSQHSHQLDHHHIYMLVMRLAEAGSQSAASELLQDPDKEGSRSDVAVAMQELQATAAACITQFSEQQMASIVWSLATLALAEGNASTSSSGGGSSSSSSNGGHIFVVDPQLLQAVSTTWAAQMAHPSSWTMEDLVSSIWGFGQLLAITTQTATPADSSSREQAINVSRASSTEMGGPAAPCDRHGADPRDQLLATGGSSSRTDHAAHSAFLDKLYGSLADDVGDPDSSAMSHWASGGSPLQPEDLTDIACGIAAANVRSPQSARLLDAVAHEVYRQLSNRHSLNATFTPKDLCKLLGAYASLQYYQGPAPRMLDAVGGYIVKRIRAQHLNAVSRPDHMAQLLSALAALDHRSVIVPEILGALSSQACTVAASSHLAYHDSHAEWKAGSRHHFTPGTVADMLEAQLRLGYRPPTMQLLSLLPALLPHAGTATPHDVVRILNSLATCRHHPGTQVLDTLLHAAETQQEAFSAKQQAALLFACGLLGHAPNEQLLGSCADAVALGEGDGLGATELTRALWALSALGALTLPRFGWLCVRLGRSQWSKLNEQQLQVLAQAELLLGLEGTQMAQEVLPPQLYANARQSLTQPLIERLNVGAQSAAMQIQQELCNLSEAGCYGMLNAQELTWDGNVRQGAWLLTLQQAMQPHLAVVNRSDSGDAGGGSSGSEVDGSSSSSRACSSQQAVLLLCQPDWYSVNEPHQATGMLLLEERLAAQLAAAASQRLRSDGCVNQSDSSTSGNLGEHEPSGGLNGCRKPPCVLRLSLQEWESCLDLQQRQVLLQVTINLCCWT